MIDHVSLATKINELNSEAKVILASLSYTKSVFENVSDASSLESRPKIFEQSSLQNIFKIILKKFPDYIQVSKVRLYNL